MDDGDHETLKITEAHYPTVADVIALDPVQNASPHVVAGAQNLDTTVRWVHSSEVPDVARLLRGGELLLMTGIGFPADDAGLRRFANELADVPICGVMVELGRRYERLPPALVREFERLQIPLIALGRECRFVEITQLVHSRIVDGQFAELQASAELHSAFTELSLEGASASEIVRQAAHLASRPVVLENLAHQVLAYETAGLDADQVLVGWETRSRSLSVGAPRTSYDDRQNWLATTVGARGHNWGRLILVCREPPSPRDHMLLERAAGALALNRLVERDRDSLDRQAHLALIDAILTHSMPTAEITTRAKAIGVSLEGRSLTAAVLRLHDDESESTLAKQTRVRDLAESVVSAVKEIGQLALVAHLDDANVAVVISAPRRVDDDKLLSLFVETLRRRISPPNADGRMNYVVATGSSVSEPADLRRSFLEALQVADAAEHEPKLPYYRLPDVRLRGLLHLLRDDERLQTYVERELGPLLVHDDQRKSDLLGVLRIFLNCGRNKSAAADAAHLSRPAFYERLNRIEKVLSVDLDSVESCLSLHVAVLGLDAMSRQTPRGSR